MYVINITDDYDNTTFINCTDKENTIDIIIPTIFFSIPGGLSFLRLLSLMICTINEPLFSRQKNNE